MDSRPSYFFDRNPTTRKISYILSYSYMNTPCPTIFIFRQILVFDHTSHQSMCRMKSRGGIGDDGLSVWRLLLVQCYTQGLPLNAPSNADRSRTVLAWISHFKTTHASLINPSRSPYREIWNMITMKSWHWSYGISMAFYETNPSIILWCWEYNKDVYEPSVPM